MALSTVIFARLSTYPAVSAIVGTRVYPVGLPQNATFPAITYTIEQEQGSEGGGHIEQMGVRVSCWAVTYTAAEALSVAVKAALRGYSNKAATPALISMDDDNMFDVYYPETQLYGRVLEFSAWIIEI